MSGLRNYTGKEKARAVARPGLPEVGVRGKEKQFSCKF
jgi:hypothetical protein